MDQPDISFFFLVYNDERTVRLVTEKAIKLFDLIANQYEVVIVDDASPNKAGEFADQLALEYPQVKVVHHTENRGYGAAVKPVLRHGI